MAEYIDREEYCEKHCRCINEYCYRVSCPIWKVPAADVAPVVHGRWRALRKYDARRTYRCSVCGRTIRLSLAIDINEYAPYCNCGARMDGDDDAKAD